MNAVWLTPWFPIQTPPVRSGVYLMEDVQTAAVYFRYFDVDTSRWGGIGLTPKAAHDRREVRMHSGYFNLAHWRGIQGETK